MLFTVNTKPLVDSLTLGIVSGNINKFDAMSTTAQLTGSEDGLRINLVAGAVKSEIVLNGSVKLSEDEIKSEDEVKYVRLVDNTILKNLITTFESNTTDIEFVAGGIVLYSGKSKLTIPEIENGGFELAQPSKPDEGDQEVDIAKDNWKFIKDYQLYALAFTFTNPSYAYVFMNKNNDVVTGDTTKSLFTHSKKSNLNKRCLVSSNIVNLLESLPDGTKLVAHDKGYIASVDTDGFSFTSEFIPRYEDDPDMGDYLSEIFLEIMAIPDSGYGSIDGYAIKKFISQIAFLSVSTKDTVILRVEGNVMTLVYNENNRSTFSINGDCPDFEKMFLLSDFVDVFTNYEEDSLCVHPVKNKDTDEIGGILVWGQELTTVLTGCDKVS